MREVQSYLEEIQQAAYENWMKRVEGFLAWMNSEEENMREGMEEEYVLPASLIRKPLNMILDDGGDLTNMVLD